MEGRRRGGPEGMPREKVLHGMLTGYWVSQSLYVAAKLGLADLLKEGSKTAEELGKAADCDGPTLYRLLRALAGVGVFAEDEEGRFGLTPLAELLQSGVPGSMRARAIIFGEELWQAWGNLLQVVKSGESHLDQAKRDAYYKANPEAAKVYNEAWVDRAKWKFDALAKVYDFSLFKKIVDVGGGHGGFLSLILQNNPGAEGVLFDLERTVSGAGPKLERAGVADRVRVVGGDFFRDDLPSDGDCYILSRVIHEFDDEESVTILSNCCRAMPPGAKIILVEQVIPPPNEHSWTKFYDLNMLICIGGKERTEEEFKELFEKAGLQYNRVVTTDTRTCIVEGENGNSR